MWKGAVQYCFLCPVKACETIPFVYLHPHPNVPGYLFIHPKGASNQQGEKKVALTFCLFSWLPVTSQGYISQHLVGASILIPGLHFEREAQMTYLKLASR